VAIIHTDEPLGYGAIDCGAYVSNFMLAAQALGLGTIPRRVGAAFRIDPPPSSSPTIAAWSAASRSAGRPRAQGQQLGPARGQPIPLFSSMKRTYRKTPIANAVGAFRCLNSAEISRCKH
jgi:hypothetical protein